MSISKPRKIEEPPKEDTFDTYGKKIHEVKQVFGLESRFLWKKHHLRAKLWNWFIDARYQRVIPPFVIILGVMTALVVLMIAWNMIQP